MRIILIIAFFRFDFGGRSKCIFRESFRKDNFVESALSKYEGDAFVKFAYYLHSSKISN